MSEPGTDRLPPVPPVTPGAVAIRSPLSTHLRYRVVR